MGERGARCRERHHERLEMGVGAPPRRGQGEQVAAAARRGRVKTRLDWRKLLAYETRVVGTVASNFTMADAEGTHAVALEAVAGAKLKQVIVDNEQTAKQLLSGGQLRNRVTIIPLNKVSARPLPGAAKKAAAELAGDRAVPALELVGYDGELEAAMQYAYWLAVIKRQP